MPRLSSIVGSFVVIGLIGLSAAMYLRLNVDSIATRFVTNRLNDYFSGTEFAARIKEAIFLEGSGFELRGFELIDAQSRKPILTVSSAFASVPAEIRDLVSLDVQPDAIELRRALLTVSDRQISSGQYQRLFALFNQVESKAKLVPIRIRDSELRYQRDDSAIFTKLTDVAIDIHPDRQNRNIVYVGCKSLGTHLKELQFQGALDLQKKDWKVQIQKLAGRCDDNLLDLLPVRMQLKGSPISGVNGDIQLVGSLSGNLASAAMPDFQFDCSITNCSLQDPDLPVTLQRCRASIAIDNNGIAVNRAEGELGNNARFEIDYQQRGLTSRKQWTLNGNCTDMSADPRLMAMFPDTCRKFCDDFSSTGIFDMQFNLDSAGRKDIRAQIKDMSFSFHLFPYVVDHCVGNVRWIDSRLNFNVEAIEQGQLLQFDGQVNNPGDQATYVFNFGTEGRLPIDEKLLSSLQKHNSVEKAFRDFRPSGKVSGRGTIKKLTPGKAVVVQKEVSIKLHECDVRHKSFDYPMQAVNGTIQIGNDGFTFQDISGSNSSGNSVCNGIWNKRDGLKLAFICNAVNLDSRLRNALTPNLRDVWDSIRPSGEIKLGRVFLSYQPGTVGLDVRVQANLGEENTSPGTPSASINPTWFPYVINNLKGRVEIGDGVIALSKILGKHGKTWLTCSGTGTYSDKEWSVKLQNLLAGSVKPDEDLLHALPVSLADAIRQLNFRGQANVSGEIAFSGSHTYPRDRSEFDFPIAQVAYESQPPPSNTVDWNLRLDMDQAEMQVGLPVENIFGSLNLNGTSNSTNANCQGRISLDSMTLYGIQITNVNGPIWIDEKQTLAGKFANVDQGEPQTLTGTAFEGQVSFDGWVSHEDKYPFFLQSTIENSELEEVAAELAPQMKETSGDAFAFLRLRGNAEELHSYTGNGNVHLKNAKIHQLPVILSLLKILSIKEVSRTAFDSSNVDFTIKGDQIKLDRIELIGDAISLIGNGYLEFMRYADINFYSVVGRNRLYIPIFSELYTAGSQRIMWINIGGPMDNLQTSRRVLPGLNDSIRALFLNSENTRGGNTRQFNLENSRTDVNVTDSSLRK